MANKWQFALSAVVIVVLVVIFILVGSKSTPQTPPEAQNGPKDAQNSQIHEIPSPAPDSTPWKE